MKSRLLLLLFSATLLFACGGKKNKPLTPAQQHASDIARRMKKIGLFAASSDEQIDSLVVHYGNDTLNGLYTMLEKSGDLYVGGLTLNGQAREQFYTKLLQDAAARVPDANIQSVSTTMRVERVNEMDINSDTSYIVTLKTKDTTYSKSIFYTSTQPIDRDFYLFINQVLADRNSNRRLFPIEFICLTCKPDSLTHELPHDETKLGLLALTNLQYDSLITMGKAFEFSNHEFMLRSSKEIRDEQARLLRSGLFDGFPDAYMQRFNRDLEENCFYSKEDMYDYADTIFTTVIIDSTITDQPYTAIANSLSAASRDKFDLGDAEETNTENETVFRCIINGKPHTYSLTAQRGYIDPKFIDHINDALEENNAGGAFYSVNHGQQEAEMVFIPDALYN
jgi:hypothetical protein